MIWGIGCIAVLGWVVALMMMTVAPARSRREALMLAHRLRQQVRPYLLRQAADAEIATGATPGEGPLSAVETVDELCRLATALQEQAQAEIALGDTMNLAVSETLAPDGKPPSGHHLS